MGTNAPNIPYWDNETRDLNQLLDAFGSAVPLEDISSAYLKGGRNIETAFEILLSKHQGSTSGTSSLSSLRSTSGSSSLSSKDEILEVSNGFTEKASISETNTIETNQKKGSASMGTVVGVIGKDYAINRPTRNAYVEGTKPPKVNIDEFSVHETTETNAPAAESMRKDTVEFLFRMLGDGFQLDMKIIQDVLGVCGYDVKKSMDKLRDISASTLEKSDDIFNITAKEISIDTCKKTAGRLVAGPRSSKSNKNRCELEKEVLECLFNVPQRIEEAPKRTGPYKAYKKPSPFGKIVTEPFKDTASELTTPVVTLLGIQEVNGEDEEDAYQDLLRRAKEFWMTMNGYYEAAADAYTKEDHERAQNLMEKGHFFKKKARELREKSIQMFLGSKDKAMSPDVHECSPKEGMSECSPEEGMSLNVLEYSPKEAMRSLKILLTSLAGSEAFPYLKIIIAGDTEGTKDAARKRQVQKFLEKESINWNEERNGRTMVIRLDKIDRNQLSFVQK